MLRKFALEILFIPIIYRKSHKSAENCSDVECLLSSEAVCAGNGKIYSDDCAYRRHVCMNSGKQQL